ncbi:MAG TPA: hypothetical protein VJJ23_01905 [Candidatus Nanoarchaeia archaeon]|nr:hypothetical protein [Candidatus Nanoarchaeia archaeon]
MEKIDRSLEGIISELTARIPNSQIDRQEVIDIKIDKDNKLVRIFPEDKYAEFCPPYEQTATETPILEPIIKYFEKNGYHTNLK